MEEIENKIEEEQNDRWITILLIIGNLIIWSIILLFVSIAKVDAAALNPSSNQIYTETITGGNPEYITIGQDTTYNLSVLKKSNLFVSNFINVGTGVFEGQATMTFNSNESCTYFRLHPEHIVLSVNDYAVPGTKSITNCVKSDSTVVLGVRYTYTNQQANSVFKLIYRLPDWTMGSFKMYSIIDYTPKDYATNTDIENQTISIINNAIQNAQDIINNSIQENILNRNAITSAVDNAASSIINNAKELSSTCTDETTNANNYDKINYYLNMQGQEISGSNWHIKDFKINKDSEIEVISNYTPQTSTASCFYYNDNLINCINNQQFRNPITIPNSANKLRVSYSTVPSVRVKTCTLNTDALLEEFDLIYSFTFNHVTPDKTQFEITHAMEDDILEMAEDIDLDRVQIDIDTDTSNWVWNTLTSFIQANAIVGSMFISILSIGIIKLLFNR